MGGEFVFITIGSLIFLLLITVYLLQQRKQPLETIQASLSDRLGVTDVIGFSLVTMTKEKEELRRQNEEVSQMTATWKTVRVFIFSTLRDMRAERDHLVRVAFPELRERKAS